MSPDTFRLMLKLAESMRKIPLRKMKRPSYRGQFTPALDNEQVFKPTRDDYFIVHRYRGDL